MISNTIPAVLTFDPPQASISTERALKNALAMLEEGQSGYTEDMAEKYQVAIDDLELMLRAIR